MNSVRCEHNLNPESVVGRVLKKVMTCKEYRKQYGVCPVYRPEFERECDITLLGKKGKIQTITYSQYMRMTK